MKTSELSGVALDWAVAKCEGNNGVWYETDKDPIPFAPSTDWAHGGLIIEREKIEIRNATQGSDGFDGWIAFCFVSFGICCNESGETPLIAAMRCYVASKLGDEVELPDELKETVND